MDLTLQFEKPAQRLALFGPAEKNLKLLRDALGVQLMVRDSALRITGNKQAVEQAVTVLEKLRKRLGKRDHIKPGEVQETIALAALDNSGRNAEGELRMVVYANGQLVQPKTDGQQHYVRAMLDNDLVFCRGPAGTGKTYLAVAMAVSLMKQGRIKRIVLVRPAVEAGEKLGFLPGDMQAKVNPYLRPLLDALHDMMDFEQIKRFMANDLIEVIPLAFMRGRTLNDAVVILDEAQNTTSSQMLMFLTRLGHGTKMIVTGDISQIDLDPPGESGMLDATRKLNGIKGIGFVGLIKTDIVRHRLVQNVVDAYARGVPAAKSATALADNTEQC